MSQTLNPIISVGYKMDFTNCREQIKTIMAEKLKVDVASLNVYEIEEVVHSGVWYFTKAKQIHDQLASQAELQSWFKKYSNIEKIYVRAFYITKKLIILEAYSGNDNFFIIASNMTKGTATTLHKKAALSGVYGPRYEIERFEIPASAYIHRQ